MEYAMNISKAHKVTGLSNKAIRFYETMKLIKPERQENGYRHYHQTDIDKLLFIKKARELTFSIDDCRILLSLYDDKNRANSNVKALADKKLQEINHKIDNLEQMRAHLMDISEKCPNNHQPDCPILEDLSH